MVRALSELAESRTERRIGRHQNFTTRPMMPSTAATPIHQANKVAPAAPRRSSVWVLRETSIQSAVNRTMPAAAAATAAQRNQFMGLLGVPLKLLLPDEALATKGKPP